MRSPNIAATPLCKPRRSIQPVGVLSQSQVADKAPFSGLTAASPSPLPHRCPTGSIDRHQVRLLLSCRRFNQELVSGGPASIPNLFAVLVMARFYLSCEYR